MCCPVFFTVMAGLCIVLHLGDVYDIMHMYFYQRGEYVCSRIIVYNCFGFGGVVVCGVDFNAF